MWQRQKNSASPIFITDKLANVINVQDERQRRQTQSFQNGAGKKKIFQFQPEKMCIYLHSNIRIRNSSAPISSFQLKINHKLSRYSDEHFQKNSSELLIYNNKTK